MKDSSAHKSLLLLCSYLMSDEDEHKDFSQTTRYDMLETVFDWLRDIDDDQRGLFLDAKKKLLIEYSQHPLHAEVERKVDYILNEAIRGGYETD